MKNPFAKLPYIIVMPVLLSASVLFSQLPDCNTMYLVSEGSIYNYDSVADATTMNAIPLPNNAEGLAVTDNYFSPTPSPTFYTTVGEKYYYYDGNDWVNTNHSTGSSNATNLGSAGVYLYNVDALEGKVYRYDGTGNDALFIDFLTSTPLDAMGDSEGNLYVLVWDGLSLELQEYDMNGDFICAYNTTGYEDDPEAVCTIVDGVVYVNALNTNTNYIGIIDGSIIDFTPISLPDAPLYIESFASCTFSPLEAVITPPDTLSCTLDEVGVTVLTTISDPVFEWNGPGIVSGEDSPTVMVNEPGVYTINITSLQGGMGCGNVTTSTVEVIGVGVDDFTGMASCDGDVTVITGVVSLSNTINVGTMTISSSCGGSLEIDLSSGIIIPYEYTLNVGAVGDDECEVSVSFSDYNDCNQMITIENPDCCTVDVPTVTVSDATCSTPGTAVIDNYIANLVYSFSPSGPTVGSGGAIIGLEPDLDYVVIASNADCSQNSLPFSIEGIQTPTLTISGGSICEGESIQITAVGSPAGGTYTWDGGLGTTNQITVSPGLTTSYGVTYAVDDCETIAITTVTVNPNQVPSFMAVGPFCEGETFTLPSTSIEGITGQWSPSINTQQTEVYTFTPSGNQCAEQVEISVIIHQNPTFNLTPTNPLFCNSPTGSITVENLSPNSDYMMDFNNTGATSVATDNSGNITVENLAPNDYMVVITDEQGCTDSLQVTVDVGEPTDLAIEEVMIQDVSCFGGDDGFAVVTASGGETPYVFTWFDDSHSEIHNGLSAGTYEVEVIDSIGCTVAHNVNIVEPSEISLSTSSTETPCTLSEGTATVVASGGTGDYTFLWTPSGQTSSTAIDLSAGLYTVDILDENGCFASTTVHVNNIDGFILSVDSISNVTCFGGSDGFVSVDVQGGTPEFSYQWSPNGGTEEAASGLLAGEYVVTVIDEEGCLAMEAVTITQPDPIQVVLNATPTECGESIGRIETSISGGIPSYTYSWSNGATGGLLTNLSFGSYEVTVTDSHGCSVSTSTSILHGGIIDVDVFPPDTTIMIGESVGLSAVADNGDATAYYTWSPTAGLSCTSCTDPFASPRKTTMYLVEVTTSDGCYGSDSVLVIIQFPCEKIYLPSLFSPNGDGVNDYFGLYGSDGGCFKEFFFGVYDRWGEELFATDDVEERWDGTYKGKMMNPGTYVWMVIGMTNDKIPIDRSGSVDLIR